MKRFAQGNQQPEPVRRAWRLALREVLGGALALVTGAQGAIGSAVVNALRNAGARVLTGGNTPKRSLTGRE